MANQKNFVHDEFVKQVRPDPKSTDPIVFMSGFIGKSPVDGHVRVYADPELSNFIDVPESAIIHSQQFTKEESPLGGSKLWVKQGEITNKGAAAAGSFLEGDISNYFNSNMYQPRIPLAGTLPPTFPPTFPPTITTTTLPQTLPPRCPFPPPTGPQVCFSNALCITVVKSICPCVTNGQPICPPITVRNVECPPLTIHTRNLVLCPITVNSADCPHVTGFVCPTATIITRGGCRSLADGCPTAPTDTTTIINPAATLQQVYQTGTFNPNIHFGYTGY
jgi:hypothetical protein